jgi:hypothetical protein
MHKTLKMFVFTAALLQAAAAQADMTAMQRAAQFGLSDIRGIAYIPGPAGPAKPLDPQFAGGSALPYFLGSLQTYNPQGNPLATPLAVAYTIYYDSDFYSADFRALWGDRGRDDLGRYKAELNANLVHLYDWNTDPKYRDHGPFLAYALAKGLHVTIPISNYTYQIMCGEIPKDNDWKTKISQVFNAVYGTQSTTPHGAAGVLKIFNEFDVSVCKNASYVADVALYWKQLEDGRSVPDANRLPIIFPVTWGIANGLPGGAVLNAFNAIVNKRGLGLDFWKSRVIYATNPFNPGSQMRTWTTTDLPAWFTSHNIPSDTPVMFTEYGRSSDQSTPPTEAGQATYVKEQFESMWQPTKPANFLGACAFVNEFRFWLAPPEPNFALSDFGKGGGAWNKPVAMYVQTEQYQNPNAPIGQLWSAKFQVDPQKPRPAYCEVANVFGGTATCP